LMFSIPLFLHDLCLVPQAKIKNIAFAILTFITYLVTRSFWLFSTNEQTELTGEYLEALIFITVVIYSFVVPFFNYKSLHDPLRKKIIRKILILLGLLIPGIIYDSIPNLSRSIVFPQLLYCGFGIIFSWYLLKNYPFHPAALTAAEQNIPDTLSEEAFFTQYNLSQREQEIAALLLKGYQNHKIAETLYIAVTTVKTHIRHMFTKFGVNSRYELLILFTKSRNVNSANPNPASF